MTLMQSKQFVLDILKKAPMLRGFKSTEFVPEYVYCPYIPLYTTADLPITQEAVAHSRYPQVAQL